MVVVVALAAAAAAAAASVLAIDKLLLPVAPASQQIKTIKYFQYCFVNFLYIFFEIVFMNINYDPEKVIWQSGLERRMHVKATYSSSVQISPGLLWSCKQHHRFESRRLEDHLVKTNHNVINKKTKLIPCVTLKNDN